MAQNQPSYTIFVRNIPYSTDGKELAQAFLQFGEISQSRIISTTFRGQAASRGFGFVDFKNQEAYDKAINNKTPITIKGENGERTLIVSQARPPRPRDTIFLGNLPETTKEENIREVFKDFNIAQIRIPQPRTPTQARKYFAFVKFTSVDDYNKAIALQNVTINDKQIKVLSARRPNNRFPFRRRGLRGRGRGRRSYRGRGRYPRRAGGRPAPAQTASPGQAPSNAQAQSS